jgi:hypothetical protein
VFRSVVRELQRVGRLQIGLVASTFDLSGEPNLVQKLGELAGSSVDHLEVPLLCLAAYAHPDEGLREPVDGGQGRAQIVRRERHEPRES